MSLLRFEAMGLPRVAQKRAVASMNHNVYEFDSRNTDDHRYMQTATRNYGAVFSKPGNGICHQVHMETFSVPGETLLGSDSHTPLCGAAGGSIASSRCPRSCRSGSRARSARGRRPRA